jgi:hypothetical protein
MQQANVMQKATWKIDSANSRIGRLPGTAKPRFCASLPSSINEKIFENLPRVFFEEKTRGEPPKTKPTKEKRKDAHAAIKS